jgi:hypothetical protein
MLETLDVFVFTFGLTECWRSKADGMVLPVAPGVIGGEWREDLFEFWNMRAGDVAADFVAFADLLRDVNPKAKVIVTVSPVPLIATYEQRHALVSNAYTKATLRIAVDEICRLRPEIVYFPGYEIATVACNAARFYDDSQRNMTPLGIQQVMRVFFKHFAADGIPSGSAPTARIDVAGEASPQLSARRICLIRQTVAGSGGLIEGNAAAKWHRGLYDPPGHRSRTSQSDRQGDQGRKI